ncbi:MAG: DUF362 domain-containing protein [Candidatus Omnitrophica bacterium]|nr:DUF362 domain-containing protein [Candidatus Omnitrophota bacterium]
MKPIYSRRAVLTSMGLAAFTGPALWLPRRSQSADSYLNPMQKSRVVIARAENILQPDNTLDAERAGKLLDEAMRALGGLGEKKEAVDVWRSLFSPADRVAIKINSLAGRMLSPHPELAYAIAERLIEIGIPADRIVIWDRSERELEKAGYDPREAKGKALLAATDSQGVGYEPQPEISGSIGSCFSRIVSKGCTALINLGVLKDHDLSGVSAAMKNLFGVIHNPNRYHFDVHKDPYLPDLCLHPYIKNKIRLTICDGFRGQYDGGPAYSPKGIWNYGGLIASTDQTAVDSVAESILSRKRRENNLPSFREQDREPLYIQLAEEKKVGRADPSRIDAVEATI